MPERSIDRFVLPRELEFLLLLVMDAPVQVDLAELDQERFLTLVSQNRLTPLVAARLRAFPKETLDRCPAFKKILAEQSATMPHVMEQMQILATLMRDFASMGLRALSLKGPMLAVKLYGNPAMRYSRDLDILVSEEDLPRACARLEAMGFTETIDSFHKTPKRRAAQSQGGEEMHRVYVRGGICVELHWRLTFRYAQSFAELWARRSVRKLLGEEINCLDPADELIYLICHGAGHGFSRLRWLVDLYERLRAKDVDISILYDRMKEKGVEALLLETLMLLYLMPGFRFPELQLPGFSMALSGKQLSIAYDQSCRDSVHHAFRLLDALYPLLLMDGEAKGMTERRYQQLLPTVNKKKNLFSYIWAVMQPCPADLARFDFPDRLYFLYYIVRPPYKLWRMTPFYRKRQAKK